ncbi:MAG: phosphate signaling complex PhoU family protein [Ktedonobacterales bacterium]
MNRTVLDRQLAELKVAVTGLGRQVESALDQSVETLEVGVRATALAICGSDQLRRERQRIDRLAALLITLHQPALRDLRATLGAISAAGELEQIGNLAWKVTARAADDMEPESRSEPLPRALLALARVAYRQVQAALAAYETSSVPAAVTVWKGDVDVDYLYATFVSSCKSALRAQPGDIAASTTMLDIAHDLERIADHAASIGERIVYIATGDPDVAETAEDHSPQAERNEPKAQAPAPLTPVPAPTMDISALGPVLAIIRLRSIFFDAFHSIRVLITGSDTSRGMSAVVRKG